MSNWHRRERLTDSRMADTCGESGDPKWTLSTVAVAPGRLVRQGRDSEWSPHSRGETAQRMCYQDNIYNIVLKYKGFDIRKTRAVIQPCQFLAN